MVNYSLESLGQSFRSGNRPTEMELELEMVSIRDGMSELGAESDMLNRAFNSAELAMNIIKNFKDEDQCLELLKCQATMESLINVNGGTINDLTVSAAQEGIKEFFKTIWEKIKAFFSKLWDYIKRFFTWLGEKMGLIKDKGTKIKEALGKVDKKKFNQALRKHKPNAKRSASKESLMPGLEDYSDIRGATVQLLPANVMDKLTSDLAAVVHDGDFILKSPELKPFVEASELMEKDITSVDISRLNDIRDGLDKLLHGGKLVFVKGCITVVIEGGELHITTSVNFDKSKQTASMYDLGYRSVEQVQQIVYRIIRISQEMFESKKPWTAERIGLKLTSERLSHMADSLESSDEVDEKGRVIAGIFRAQGRLCAVMNKMCMIASKTLARILDLEYQVFLDVLSEAGAPLDFKYSMLEFTNNTLPE